jgi:glycosyltransferase involved in cell wall biosynthesis
VKRRRVLIIVENLPVPFDRRVWQEARTLRDAGYEVSVIGPSGPGCEARRETIDGIAIFRHPLPLEARGALGYLVEYSAALLWEHLLAWRVFFGRGFDAIHACNPPDLIFLVGAVFKLLGKRFLFDHHDLGPELYEAKFGRRGLVHRLLRLFERLSFRLADVVIATNESYRRIAIERGGVDPARVFVVRSGPDLTRLRPVAPVPELRRGRRHLVGYVGVIGKQEGLDYLLHAVRHIVRERGREDVHFAVVGGGPELEALKALAKRLEIEDFVTFAGRVPDSELLAVLSSADVCVNPDAVNPMNDKSTMNKVLEYMALGKPIVQFDLAEGRFSAQEAALYARPNDAVDLAAKLLELLDDPERRRRMGEFGRRRVEEVLEWRHQAPRLLEAYERLFGGMGHDGVRP